MLVLYIKEIRVLKGISLDNLGKKIGYSKSYMHKLEVGERKLSFEMALLISKALKVDVDKLGEIV